MQITEFLSTYKEVHSFGIGIMDGVSHKKNKSVYDSLDQARNSISDVDQEPHYYRTGYAVGRASKYFGSGVIIGSQVF